MDTSPLGSTDLHLSRPADARNLVPVVHDWRFHRRIHPATGFGFGLLFLAIPLIVGLSGSEAWAQLLASVLGPPGGGAP